MNKNGFINRLAEEAGLPLGKAKVVTNAIIQIITKEMTGGVPISFSGFGSFQPIYQAERLARNPKTGAPVMIKERNTVKFKAGTILLQNVNSVKSQPSKE